MIKEWKDSILFEFENGYKVRIPYVKSVSMPVPVKPKIDVMGPNNEYLTPNFLGNQYGINLDANDIVDILARVKSIDKNENLDIL